MSWAEYHCLRISWHASFRMILDCFACIWWKLVDNLVEMWTIHVRLWIGGVSRINLYDSSHLWTIKDGLGSRIAWDKSGGLRACHFASFGMFWELIWKSEEDLALNLHHFQHRFLKNRQDQLKKDQSLIHHAKDKSGSSPSWKLQSYKSTGLAGNQEKQEKKKKLG